MFRAFAFWSNWRKNETWPRPSVQPYSPYVVITAALFSVSISLRNSASAKLPLSFAQLLASLSPIFTYTLSVLFGFEKLRACAFFSLCACVFGVWFGLTGSLEASWRGVALQATGVFLQTFQAVLLQKLMAGRQTRGSVDVDGKHDVPSKVSTTSPTQRSAERPTPAETLAVYAPYCAAMLLLPAFVLEWEGVLRETTTRPPSFCLLIAGNVAVALALNLAVATCIYRYTALTLSLSGLAKDWTAVAASNVVFGKEVTGNFVVGMTFVTLAMIFYTFSSRKPKNFNATDVTIKKMEEKNDRALVCGVDSL